MCDERLPLTGNDRKLAEFIIEKNHYAHSIPSGKTHYFCINDAYFAFSIPANKNISTFLVGTPGKVWELARMWACDNHKPNALTQGLSGAVAGLRAVENVDALVSYADPNVGHTGHVYRAASWVYLGQSEEGRYYRDGVGQVVSRRKFHSGSRSLTKSEILALGYSELKLPGKHRFARGLTRIARRAILQKAALIGGLHEKSNEPSKRERPRA